MQDFEKLGVFYLGRLFDPIRKTPRDDLVLYDSKDLVTHAVCVGMTGSGKTGLCISILEEAAIDNIPALVIDPKGDLTNLLLTFPRLQAADFLPWVNETDARNQGLTAEQFAKKQAEQWKKGLAEWGQDGARIQRLKDAADFAIYTPGSTAGLPVSILKSFAVPPPAILQESELLRERVQTTATSLLALLGIQADPIQSREHILLSTILSQGWKQGRSFDLADLIQQIQTPPFQRVGILELESFFPAKDRFALAMMLNNLLAAPGFEAWLEGEALDIDSFLHTPQGKPRIAIFSIAHLGDAERMFFVALLLNQVLGWMRSQPGTTSLRALVYMDEIFGYFPPVANPPTKTPLLTLLKQARAFGVGLVLATQNPVDLDYKGLANTGTWFIGRLQTERDKARLLDGLEGASTSTGSAFDRGTMEKTLAGLGNRIFLMHNVHEDQPIVFQTRWALSYLRGPLTRNQIKTIMAGYPRPAGGATRASDDAAPAPAASPAQSPTQAAAAPAAVGGPRPLLPPEIVQVFLPARSSKVVYRPMLLGSAEVYFTDPKAGVDLRQPLTFLTPLADGAVAVNWEDSEADDVSEGDLEKTPAPDALFATLPSAAAQARNYDAWKKSFADWLFRTQKLDVLKSPSLGEIAKPGESEREFRVRIQQAAREQRDLKIEQLRQKFAPKLAALEERIRRAQQAVEREGDQATQSKFQTVLSFGSTLLGALFGRKKLSATNVGKATTSLRTAGRAMKDSKDIARAKETVAALEKQYAELEAAFKEETEELTTRSDAMTEELETITIKAKKTNVGVKLVALAWVPD